MAAALVSRTSVRKDVKIRLLHRGLCRSGGTADTLALRASVLGRESANLSFGTMSLSSIGKDSRPLSEKTGVQVPAETLPAVL